MTSNPSEEQLELVQGRILELSSALYPYVGLDEDGNSYFDEVRSLRHCTGCACPPSPTPSAQAGYDEAMAAQLVAALKEYIECACHPGSRSRT